MIGKERGAVGTTEIMQYPAGANGGAQPLGRRTWVGLTADEYAELAEEYGPFPINQIEAKLKEKNT